MNVKTRSSFHGIKTLSTACFFAVTSLSTAIAAEGFPSQRIIVKYRSSSLISNNSRTNVATRTLADISAHQGIALKKVRTLSTGADVVTLPQRLSKQRLSTLIQALAVRPEVEYAEEDRILKRAVVANDSRYTQQWHYFEPTAGINLPMAWAISTGAGVNVAVLDTGYRPHADLSANILGGYDFISDTFMSNDGDYRDSDARDPGDWNEANECMDGEPAYPSSWHGTHVAGTIAASTNNATGVAGIAYRSKIVPVRVLGRCGGYTSDIADGIIWAAGGTVAGVPVNQNRAHVINMSLAGYGPCDQTLQNAINTARARNTSIIVAAGNTSENSANTSPANCQGVITVVAVDRNGKKSIYSNFGTNVDVAAPGGDTRISPSNGVLSTVNSGTTVPANDHYEFYQGTSMATPHVAGIVALMLAANKTLTPDQIENTLKKSVRAFPSSCLGCGTGMVDALKAVSAATSGVATAPVCQAGFTSHTDTLNVSWLSSYKPSFNGYAITQNRTLSAYLTGPTNANFDLYLERKHGTGWTSAAGAQTLGSNERIDYTATPATYRWRVYSQSGRGSYVLCVKNP